MKRAKRAPETTARIRCRTCGELNVPLTHIRVVYVGYRPYIWQRCTCGRRDTFDTSATPQMVETCMANGVAGSGIPDPEFER